MSVTVLDKPLQIHQLFQRTGDLTSISHYFEVQGYKNVTH